MKTNGFRDELVRAERHVCSLIESLLRDNDRHDVLDQLVSVRRSIHYTLAHNGLPLATREELTTLAFPARTPDGAMESLVRAQETALVLMSNGLAHINIRPLDSAIETLEHAIGRGRTSVLVNGLLSPLDSGIVRVFMDVATWPSAPFEVASAAFVDSIGGELYVSDKSKDITDVDLLPPEESRQPPMIMCGMILNFFLHPKAERIELWSNDVGCTHGFGALLRTVKNLRPLSVGTLPSRINNIDQLIRNYATGAIPDRPRNKPSLLDSARWMSTVLEAQQSISDRALTAAVQRG